MQQGKLVFEPASKHRGLMATPTQDAIQALQLDGVLACPINADLSDTAAFCDYYGIGMDISANCVVLQATRAERTWYAACIVLATSRADINGVVRRFLDARKISFAPMDTATTLTGMEFGGITPIGLPADWPILVDSAVAHLDHIVIGSGLRASKLLVPGALVAGLPNATVLNLAKKHTD